MVAGMPRGVGTSIGRGKRDQSDGVKFSFVRWCSENVRFDGGHGAVRSWLGPTLAKPTLAKKMLTDFDKP